MLGQDLLLSVPFPKILEHLTPTTMTSLFSVDKTSLFATAAGSLLLGVLRFADVDSGRSSVVSLGDDGTDSFLVDSGGEVSTTNCLPVESVVGCVDVDACSFGLGFAFLVASVTMFIAAVILSELTLVVDFSLDVDMIKFPSFFNLFFNLLVYKRTFFTSAQ